MGLDRKNDGEMRDRAVESTGLPLAQGDKVQPWGIRINLE